MIEYQNIFTQVQVRGPAEMGLDNEAGTMAAERMGTPWFSNLAGWIGNAQLGPVYLGWTGMIGLATGLAWFFIVGISMLAQVDWSLPEFLRQGFWLALEPPGPEHGLSMPPLNDGGLYIIASFFLLVSVCHVVDAYLSFGARAKDGQTCGLGLRQCDLVVLGAWLVPARPDGQLV